MSDRPRFRRRDAPPARGVGPLLGALFVATVLAALVAVMRPDPSTAALVEVQGDVPRPGTYLVDPPTLAAALRAAGADPAIAPEPQAVPDGFRVRVDGGEVELLPPSDPLLVGLPVDVNQAQVHELMAIPGLGPSTAGAIVAHREDHGPFPNLDALSRVSGLGPSSIERLRPFLIVPDPQPTPEPEPVDINRATADQLETLPGIGPVMAARIVVERAEGGPFATVDDLQRVHGIGPALVAGLASEAIAGASE